MPREVTKKRDLSHLTQEDIEQHASEGFTMLYDFYGSTVKRYADNIVVKHSDKSSKRPESEAAALQFATQLGLPVPQLHEKDGPTLRMDFVEGETLKSAWPTLSVEEKHNVCGQLREILDTMRKAKWPGTLIGSCGGGPVVDSRMYGIKTGGPFHSEKDLNEFILDIYEKTPRPMRDAFVKHLRTDHRIVFSHGDLYPGNIMVKDGSITGLLDWELAGWYPEYWDYVKFCYLGGSDTDWMDYAKEIFPRTYDEELLFHLALSRFQIG
ncbi:kinase-like protein [Massarina eburnea CBS 473.64]|uniref:Kinase-like protein n=1 Tax=Massarina eburnea CBS 473.64 TaxID=1395130 RepID=A0A6A6RRB2_9PLEO|nr:kinase-like protein [Massarina eburnea CBS 473.64]